MNCCNLREGNLYVGGRRKQANKNMEEMHKEKNGLGSPSWIVKKLLLYINAEHTSLTEAHSKAENALAKRGSYLNSSS